MAEKCRGEDRFARLKARFHQVLVVFAAAAHMRIRFRIIVERTSIFAAILVRLAEGKEQIDAIVRRQFRAFEVFLHDRGIGFGKANRLQIGERPPRRPKTGTACDRLAIGQNRPRLQAVCTQRMSVEQPTFGAFRAFFHQFVPDRQRGGIVADGGKDIPLELAK